MCLSDVLADGSAQPQPGLTDALVAAREAALAARHGPVPGSAPAAPQRDAAASDPGGGALPGPDAASGNQRQGGRPGLAEALAQAQQLAAEQVRARQQDEVDAQRAQEARATSNGAAAVNLRPDQASATAGEAYRLFYSAQELHVLAHVILAQQLVYAGWLLHLFFCRNHDGLSVPEKIC